jgi:hypothetical protein
MKHPQPPNPYEATVLGSPPSPDPIRRTRIATWCIATALACGALIGICAYLSLAVGLLDRLPGRYWPHIATIWIGHAAILIGCVALGTGLWFGTWRQKALLAFIALSYAPWVWKVAVYVSRRFGLY